MQLAVVLLAYLSASVKDGTSIVVSLQFTTLSESLSFHFQCLKVMSLENQLLAIQRRRNNITLLFQCPLCAEQVRGQDKLQNHVEFVHGVQLVAFDNVVDLEGLLEAIRTRAARDSGRIACLQCEEVVPLNAMKEHCAEHAHAEWAPATIPFLVEFCLEGSSTVASLAAKRDRANAVNDDENDDDWQSDNEDDEGFANIPAPCLFCSEVSPNPLSHMKAAHGFDFVASLRDAQAKQTIARAATAQAVPSGPADDAIVVEGDSSCIEHDRIRVVNFIRWKVARNECPVGAARCQAKFDSTDALRAHIAESSHCMPPLPITLAAAELSDLGANDDTTAADRLLLPTVSGDGMIQVVLMLEDDEEEAGEDNYPMVPTVAELMQRKLAQDGDADEEEEEQ